MNIHGLCGSLRKDSSNARLLHAASTYLKNHEWSYSDLETLPYFRPEKQFNDTPPIVEDLRKIIGYCDLLLITTPEYAHGIPGVLKNALEWVFCEGTMKKKVAVIVGSAQGENTRDQLVEVLRTMDFSITLDETLIVKGARSVLGSDGIFLDEAQKTQFERFLDRLSSAAS